MQALDVRREETVNFLKTQATKIQGQIDGLRQKIAELPEGEDKARRLAQLDCRQKALKTYEIMQQMTEFACCDQFLDCPDPF